MCSTPRLGKPRSIAAFAAVAASRLSGSEMSPVRMCHTACAGPLAFGGPASADRAGECASTWADAAKGPTPLNALMESIGEGIATQVVAALEAGADPNGVDDVELRWTASAASAAALPLVRVGYSQGEAAAAHSVKALLGAGPTTCNRATHDALTPALWCVLLGRTSLLATLQAGGADLDLALPQAGSRTPLYQASDLLRMHMDAP